MVKTKTEVRRRNSKVKKIFSNNNTNLINSKNLLIGNLDELKLISPFACFVVGCTGSGKSVSVLDWLKNSDKVFKTKFTKIYYFYGSCHQDIFNDSKLRHVIFSNDLNTMEKLIQKPHKPPGILIILDDLMNVTGGSEIFQNLYTKGSHHLNISVINIIQNIFYKSPIFVTLKENSQYIFIKKHVNENKLKILANAIGLEPKDLMQAYVESDFKNRYEGLLIDNHISSNIRKVSKIRDKLSTYPGVYITDEKFKFYSDKNVIKKIDSHNYFLDFNKLKDSY